MDLLCTPQEHDFRREVRSFIEAKLPDEMRRRLRAGGFVSRDDQVYWQRALDAQGWGAPSWPVEYGGPGWSTAQQMIFANECALAPAPTQHIFNIAMLGPVLIKFGSDAQRDYFLPRLRNAEIMSCQGFSEPGAGSDLASLKTSARKVVDGYVINGTKIWTSHAHYSDWIFCLVRTDPGAPKKQAGISFMLIDLKSPGITIRPIIGLDGRHSLNQVFFDDVHIPLGNIVGEENKGWNYAKYLLGHERSFVAGIGRTRERVSFAQELLTRLVGDGVAPTILAGWRGRAALIDADLHALEITQMRFKDHGADPVMASMLKVRGSELYQQIAELLIQMGGHNALRRDAPELATTYFYSRAVTIFGGSSEVQKNILASSVLGL